jgi:hypothetical protein
MGILEKKEKEKKKESVLIERILGRSSPIGMNDDFDLELYLSS